jgi:hypothetical protein
LAMKIPKIRSPCGILKFSKLAKVKNELWNLIQHTVNGLVGLVISNCLLLRSRCKQEKMKYSTSRGRILGRNPDKSLKSFPPCYSHSPLQLCLEISIFFKTHASSYVFLQVLYLGRARIRFSTWGGRGSGSLEDVSFFRRQRTGSHSLFSARTYIFSRK